MLIRSAPHWGCLGLVILAAFAPSPAHASDFGGLADLFLMFQGAIACIVETVVGLLVAMRVLRSHRLRAGRWVWLLALLSCPVTILAVGALCLTRIPARGSDAIDLTFPLVALGLVLQAFVVWLLFSIASIPVCPVELEPADDFDAELSAEIQAEISSKS